MIYPYDIYFMKVALKEANIAFVNNEVPIGSAIIYNNVVIAKTHNLTEKLCNITAHAEILAINIASRILNKKYIQKCTLYTTIEPCIMCAGALYLTRIGRIVCGGELSNISKNGFISNGIKLHPKTKYVSGIMKQQCVSLIKKFFLLKRINKKLK